MSVERKLTVENFVLIWFDENLSAFPDCSLLSFINTKRFFSNPEQFQEFIRREIHGEQIFLVSSKTFAENRSINNHEEIYSIYIYSNESIEFEITNKIKGIYSNLQTLFEAIRRDFRQANQDLISTTCCNSTSLVFKEILLNKQSSNENKSKLIEYARFYYSKNENQLKIIDEYEQTTDEQITPIEWFTRDCFLSSIIHRTLRLYDLDNFQKIAFFIQKLHQQIADLHRQSSSPEKLTVYFQQTISNEDFQKINSNANSLICFNDFLLTTIDRDLSLEFARNQTSNSISILYEIDIDRTTCSFPFTSLNQFDYYHNTDQYVLLSFNPIFRRNQIEQIDQQIYSIKLTLLDPQSIPTPINFFQLARQLFHTNQFIQSQYIFHYLSLHSSAKHLPSIRSYLGRIYEKQANYTQALEQFEQCVQLDSTSKQRRAICLQAIGAIQEKLGRLTQARHAYEQSIETYTKNESYIFKFAQLNLSRLLIKQNMNINSP